MIYLRFLNLRTAIAGGIMMSLLSTTISDLKLLWLRKKKFCSCNRSDKNSDSNVCDKKSDCGSSRTVWGNWLNIQLEILISTVCIIDWFDHEYWNNFWSYVLEYMGDSTASSKFIGYLARCERIANFPKKLLSKYKKIDK